MHYQAGAGGDGLVVNPTTTLITITSEEASLPGNVVVFNLDVANHVWNVWLGGPAVSNSFVLVNGGVLLSPPEAERARRAAQQAGGEARRYPAANRPAAFK
jgi:RNase P/RNase MRP subunit p29